MGIAMTETRDAFAEKVGTNLKAISDLLRKQESLADRFRAENENHTYVVLGAVYDLGLECLKPENADAFVLELLKRGLKPPAEDENPWTQVLKMATGQWIGTGPKRRFEPNRTYANYGRAMRALEALGTNPGTAAEVITKFKNKKHGKGIKGLKKLDEDAHPKVTRATETDALTAALENDPIDLELPDAPLVGTCVLVWCRVVEGRIVPMGVVPNSEKDALKAARAAGLLLLSTPSEEEVAALIEEERGPIQFHDDIGSGRALSQVPA